MVKSILFAVGISSAIPCFGELDDTCIGRNKYFPLIREFSLNSPYSVLDTPAGYLPHLAIANVILVMGRSASNYFRRCNEQVEDLRSLMKEANLSLKSIDCNVNGSSESNEVDIEFWTSEMDTDNELKTKSFQLNYTMGIAQEGGDDDEDPPKKGKKKHHYASNEATLYIFGRNKLKEVRQVVGRENEQRCEIKKPGSPVFDRYKSDIEKYRKIFYYMGQHDSCMACKRQIRLGLGSKLAPTALKIESGPPDSARTVPSAGTAPEDKNTSNDEEDDE